MATLLELITDALGEIGVLAEGEVPTAAQASHALRKTNDLVDQWAAERLAIYTVTRTVFALTASDGEYTVGTGGDIAIVRPVFIDHVNLIDTTQDPDLETPLHELTEDEYAAISQKARTSARCDSWYYNPTFSTARGTLSLFPIQTDSDLSLALYTPTAVPEFTATSDTVSLPPGYKRMIVKNLAVELAPSYQRQIDPELRQQARDAKGVVKRANVRLRDLQFPADALIGGAGGTYDIERG